jgi:anti-sigma B factor antagonist
VILDMTELQYMNSTGLNILINVLTRTRNAGGDTLIAGVSNSVRQLFLVTKLDTVFTMTATIDEAVAKLNS